MRILAGVAIFVGIVIFPSMSQTFNKRNLQIGIDVAPSVTVGVDDVRQFAVGYALSADVFYLLDQVPLLFKRLYFLPGIRYSYSRWAPARDYFRDQIANITNLDTDGDAWSMEIAGILRLKTDFPDPDNVVNLFMQGGAGLYIIHSETEVTGTVNGTPFSQTFGTGTNAHFGLSISGGVTIGDPHPVMFLIYPKYNKVFRDERPDEYWTFNGGLVFGFF